LGINLVVAVTDSDWFETLRQRQDLPEVNFWAPSGSSFKALQPGELFLFKLHAPRNVIVGGGVFAYANQLPCSLAWSAFGEANGASSLREMRQRVAKYRKADAADRVSDFLLGCRILTQPFFLPEHDWIPVPQSWSRNIVSFKTYNSDEADGSRLWKQMSLGLTRSSAFQLTEPIARYGEPRLIQPRLGQGAFRILVTDLYCRRCAVTHEKTLPALEAAHIRPYADGGLHLANNGLLLRRDLHSLFDAGYVTVTPDCRFEVSRRIKEEFDNGRHYYALHGQSIDVPKNLSDRPDVESLRWHNEQCFKG
jgi:putative restriction endonuclease